MNSYYGSYRTRTFADIFPNEVEFANLYFAGEGLYAGFIPEEVGQHASTIYLMLYARYGNSHISYSDENQFRAALGLIMYQYAPTCFKRLEVQQKLRDMSDDELTLGSKAIYNHAYNPGTPPGTSTLEELLTINDQNTTNYKKSKLEGWSILLSLLETDIVEDFVRQFSKLFIKVTYPDYPLLYETEVQLND